MNHQGLFPAVTISFNLQPGVALGDAVNAIDAAAAKIGLPATIQTGFAGTAQAYQDSLGSEPILIAAALATVYIVLGILYESYIHPITILSTLPSAGVGALLALMLTHTDLSIIAIIGIILLIGIVKKNAIMMIDFALAAERNEGKNSRDAIFEACMLRFRPILMTTMAAMLGALPLALGTRHRIGVAPAAGNHDHRRIDRQPDADALHDPGGVPVLRPAAALVGPRTRETAGPESAGVGGLKMKSLKFAPALLAGLLLSSCMVGPNYKRPAAPLTPAFKEPLPEGWKEAQPKDGALKGKWWEIYNDPALNALEEQVNISNQNVLAAEAQFREARDAVRVARAALFPTIGTNPAITNSRTGTGGTATFGNSSPIHNSFTLPADFSYQVDLWGSIRRGVTQSANLAQASFAQLENARLSYQAELASDYFELHGLDGDAELLGRTVKSYADYLKLTEDRLHSGVASGSDVAQAQTQLETARASLIDLQVARAQYEHAIAVLIGKPPAQVEIPALVLKTPPPPIPTGVPSALLERRPDISEFERQVAAANEQIGIDQAAFYPTLTLTASAGLQGTSLLNIFQWPSRFWSVGPGLAYTLFDAGRRRAIVAEARDAYDVTVANYRQSVLAAFQQVEDNLAALRVLQNEATPVTAAVKAAEDALNISTYQYKAGTVNYLQVIISQTAALSAERTAVDLLTRRLNASVLLVEALGGGWDASQLPTPESLRSSR